MHAKTFVSKPEQKKPIESLGINRKIILNRMLELVETSCEYANKLSDSNKVSWTILRFIKVAKKIMTNKFHTENLFM